VAQAALEGQRRPRGGEREAALLPAAAAPAAIVGRGPGARPHARGHQGGSERWRRQAAPPRPARGSGMGLPLGMGLEVPLEQDERDQGLGDARDAEDRDPAGRGLEAPPAANLAPRPVSG